VKEDTPKKRRKTPLSNPSADPRACTHDTRITVCGQVPMFANLTVDQLHQVVAHCQAHGYEAAQSIFTEGSEATHIYIVATGAVKTTRVAADGRESLIDLHAPGDFFGALPALGRTTYAKTAWTLTPTCVLSLDAREYDYLMAEIPEIAMATLRGVAQRLTDSQRTIHMLAGAPLEQRLAALLIVLANKVGRPWNDRTLLDVPLSREDLAAMVGVATESVSRLLSQWHRNGWIEAGRRWVAIIDMAALDRLENNDL